MFSGLIRHPGVVASNRRNRVMIKTVPIKAKWGDSIAVNGVCLTVTGVKNGRISFDVSEETLSKTTIKDWKPGQRVNVEPALRASDALGGHIVQGHVDGAARVVKRTDKKGSRELWFQAPKGLARFIVPKGSVTINGVSLTAARVAKGRFSVALVPFTLKHTNLNLLKVGDKVNFEADILAKYTLAASKRK